MSEHKRFHIKDLQALRDELAALGLVLPLDENITVLGEPLSIGWRSVPNRFAIQPMEGFDSVEDGGPGPLTFRRYKRYAEGGTGLIWFEATAVLAEARSNPRQLCIHPGNVDGFRRLVAETRNAARHKYGRDPVLVIQLTHSGRYSKPAGVPRPIIAHHSAVLDPRHKLPPDYPLVTDDYLDRLQDVYVEAARLAADAGFDGVDVKSCHRYLVSELLASFTREGRYGGSFENRTRLLRETLHKIAKALPQVFITTRMNAFDAIDYPYGFGVNQKDARVPDLAEPVRLAKELAGLGVPVLNVSIGNPYFNPHYGRPFDFPIQGMAAPSEHPLEAIVRFANVTRTIQEAIPHVPLIASGYTWLRHLLPYVGAGLIRERWAMLVGQGRGAFAYPDSVHDVLTTGRMDPAKCCVTCSACTQIMRDGGMTGCVVRDSEIYGPQYRLARRFALDRLMEEAQRCRECEAPTCRTGCPAHVDVPRFVKAFAEGDFRKAYDVLRENNVLPEMCGFVCPSEEQCEGSCVENIFCERPIAIRDIQLETCRIARREGYTGVRVPPGPPRGRAAIVGGGPAGIACAVKLVEAGYEVSILEKDRALGGTPDTAIPSGRYGEEAALEINAILKPALEAGRVRIESGAGLGPALSLDELRRDYGAVFLATGLSASVSLGSAKGVVDALAFLRQAKSGSMASVPARVAVIGGGNTAMDAACTAKHLGAPDVYLVYRRSFAEMPAWPAEREKALQAGVHLMILTQPLGYEADSQGLVTGIRIARTELGPADASGRRRPRVVSGTESILAVDLVVEAIGQAIPDDLRQAMSGVSFTAEGLVGTLPGSQATGVPGVFAGGDLVNGGTTAVQGVAEGVRAAGEIDRLLRGSTP